MKITYKHFEAYILSKSPMKEFYFDKKIKTILNKILTFLEYSNSSNVLERLFLFMQITKIVRINSKETKLLRKMLICMGRNGNS